MITAPNSALFSLETRKVHPINRYVNMPFFIQKHSLKAQAHTNKSLTENTRI